MTQPSQVRMSVVIPAYNAASTIAEQLDALEHQVDAPSFEVIVADNRSTDGTAEVARRHAGELSLRVVDAHRRQGVNCARNEGARAAEGEYIVLLDADDRAGASTLALFCAALDADPGIGVVSGIIEGSSLDRAQTPVQGYLPYALGGFQAIRGTALREVGGFDEDFVGGHDEVDFCWRLQQRGWRIAVVPEATLDRRERPTLGAAFTQFRRYGFTYIQLYVKHRDRALLRGGSWKKEVRSVQDLLLEARAVLARRQPPIDLARTLGWTLGRWQGNLAFRVWGPR